MKTQLINRTEFNLYLQLTVHAFILKNFRRLTSSSVLAFQKLFFLYFFSFCTVYVVVASDKLAIQALSGDENAQFLLGQILLFGKGADPQEALIWLTKAAKQGNSIACKQVGRAFALGLGTPRNLSRAIHWYLRGAKAGNTHSLFSLYLLHKENGSRLQAGASLSLAVRQHKNPNWQNILNKMKLQFSPLEHKSLETEISNLKTRIQELPKFTKENPPLENARLQQLTFPNGDTYIGETKNGRAHGYGRKSTQHGESHFGFFENGLQEGYGLAFDSKGIVRFKGTWKRGNPLIEQPISQSKRK